MAGRVYATRSDIRISAAINQPFTPAGDDVLEVIGRDDPTSIGRDIRRIQVTNAVGMPFGRFSIELAPRPVLRGQTWAELIKPYSRVSISFQRIGDRTDPATTQRPVPLMVGLVDRPDLAQDFSAAQPRRTSRLTGRMLSSLLTDQRWWFHGALSASQGTAAAPPLLPKFSDFLVGPTPTPDVVEDEAAIRLLGALAVDKELFSIVNPTPARLMEAAYRFFVVGNGRRSPFIGVNFADGRALADLLRFDPDLAQASFFDPAARIAFQQLPTTTLPNASCWDVMTMFAEPPYTEMFSEVRGTSIDDAYVEVISRKPPFAGSIGDVNGRASVIFSGQRPALRGQTLFDEQVPGWDRFADTIYVRDGDNVIAQPTLFRSVEGNAGVYTLYLVTPRLAPLTGHQRQDYWKQFIIPIPDEDVDSPSYIRRYGVRPFEKAMKTLVAVNPLDEATPDADLIRRCGAYAALAREWFYRMPEMWSGTYELKGDPNVRAGKRLVDVDRKMEFYVVAVVHTIDNENGGLFTTTAQVTRGWPIDQAV